jgi:hypothetical protein
MDSRKKENIYASGQTRSAAAKFLIRYFAPAVLLLGLFSPVRKAEAQGMPFPPPNQLQVFSAQGLSFGSFYVGATGGTIEINPVSGSRSTTGSVVELMSDPGLPAIFIVKLIPGRSVSISFGMLPAILTRSGGGETISIIELTSDKPGNSFVTSGGHPFHNEVRIGGTLQVGSISANPSGEYQGMFNVTFNQE